MQRDNEFVIYNAYDVPPGFMTQEDEEHAHGSIIQWFVCILCI